MTTASRAKHILFVDDDPGARLIVETMLRARLPGVRVTTAINGVHALTVLGRSPVDLLITDLAMPVMDGIELLLNLAHRRILVPVLVVTANGSPAAETVALAGGAIEYFEKPLAEARFVRCVQDLLLAGDGRSRLEVVSLAGIVRLISTDRRTCTLQVTSPQAQGVLLFSAGDLVDARQGELSGLPAALSILAWDEVTLNLDIKARARARTIHASVAEVLNQAARRDGPGALPLEVPTMPAPRAEWVPAADAAPTPAPTRPSPGANPTPIRPELPTLVAGQPPRIGAPASLASRTPPLASPRLTPPVPAPPRPTAPRTAGGGNAYTSRAGAASSAAASLASSTAAQDALAHSTEPGAPVEATLPCPIDAPAPIACDAALTTSPAVITVEAPRATEASLMAKAAIAIRAPIRMTEIPAVTVIPERIAARMEGESPANTAPTLHAHTEPTRAAPVEYAESDTYYDLIDRARERLRGAHLDAAERLLLRALELQPGDRVAQQNLKVLARRRGATP